MSVDLYVYLRDAEIPTREQWQEAIDEAGIDLVLDKEFSVREHEGGFVPVLMGEEETGFEFYLDSLDESYIPDEPNAAQRLADRGCVAAFRLSDLQEWVAAMYAAAVLTQLANGLLCDAQIGELVDGARAMEMAHEAAEELSKG